MMFKAVEFKKLNETELLGFIGRNECVQIVPLRFYAGETHVVHSVNQTLKAFAMRENLSKKQSMEFLLRFFGERQIKKAVAKAQPEKRSLFVCWSEDCDGVFADFEKSFEFYERALPHVSVDKEKKAVERTSVFWLSK
ncbi:hypothetical protein H0N95_01615 [Candidatus Micrarchaeota archaeon]|nr:hypothetical protein [Candidatus Micrarchaeota archaeon]